MKSLTKRSLAAFKHVLGNTPPEEYVINWNAGDTSKDYLLQEWVLTQEPMLKGGALSWCTAIGVIEGIMHIADNPVDSLFEE